MPAALSRRGGVTAASWVRPPLVGPIDPSRRSALPRGLAPSLIGLGTGPLGNLYAELDERDAEATVRAAVAAGVAHFDTAPLYGAGVAERRLGRVLRDLPRDSYVLSTKAGFLVRPSSAGQGGDTAELSLFAGSDAFRAVVDFSARGILQSLDESLDRLGLERVDVLYLHEPERAPQRALREALPALVRLREQALVAAVGAGTSDVALLTRIVEAADVDVVLLSGGWTLLDQSAARRLLPLVQARGVAVVLGSLFHGGLLLDAERRFHYAWAAPLRPRLEAVRRVAAAHRVPLAAAAIRFGLAHPAVAAVLIGARSAAEVASNIEGLEVEIPRRFWFDLAHAGLLETYSDGVPRGLGSDQ